MSMNIQSSEPTNEKWAVQRQTRETEISMNLNLQGRGACLGSTSIGFFDHMLVTFCHYSGFDLDFMLTGDFHVDQHHSLEDFGCVLGRALKLAIDKSPDLRRRRYSHKYVPMDESLVRVVIDISGRPFLKYNVPKLRDWIGELESDCLKEFLRAFVHNAGFTCHIDILEGDNSHHMVEGLFKALALSLKEALTADSDGIGPHSTKGMID